MKKVIACVLLVALTSSSFAAGSAVPTSKLQTIVASERALYIDRMAASLKSYCAQKNNQCMAELLVRPNNMPWPDPYALLRVDMASNVNGDFDAARYEPDTPQSGGISKTFSVGALSIKLSPFVWSRVEVRGGPMPRDTKLLTEWANKWIDVKDSKSKDERGLQGVIHSVTYPTVLNGYCQFVVDFGSAPVESFDELLSVVAAFGWKHVEIGTFTALE